MFEHRAPVQPDHDDCNDENQEVIPGLGIRPNRIIQLEVEQDGSEETTAGIIEYRCKDNGHRNPAYEVWQERPGTLESPADQESRDVPDHPNDAKDQTSPEWGEPALE